MASHHRNHHRSASMAASTSAASSSSHNHNFASASSSRYMNHPNHSTASIHVSNPSTTTNSASARIRQLWQTFERAAANGRSTMEHKINAATGKADADYKKTPIQQRTLTPSQHEERKVKLAKEIKERYFDSVRTDWLARLSGAGLNPEEWTDMTEGEMKNVARVLGDDDGGVSGAGDGDDSDGSIEESDEELVFVQNKSGFPMANAPSMMSASMRSSNVSTSTTSSYAVVNPSEFHSEDGDGDYFFNPASVMATSHDLTSDDDDGYMSQSHHSHASYTQHATASNQFGPWSHNASSDSLNSSHSNHNAGYFSATSSTSASRPAPLTSTASYSAQAHQQQPNTPRNGTFPSTGGSAWAASQNQKVKSNSQYASSASMYASNSASGTSSKPDNGAVVAPKPRQVYIGPHLLDDESGTTETTNSSNPGSNDADRENDDKTGFSSDEEADFEVFKMRTRMLKIVEFHQAAALAEIKLAVGIYEDRRKALSSAAAKASRGSSSSLLTNSNPKGKNGKSKANGKENEDEDAGDASRSAERISISIRLADHEKKMIQLQKEKEEERKEMVRGERRRRRGEIELKKQSTVNVNGPTLNGAGKGRGRSGTATASTPAMRRGSISAILGNNNNSAPITSSAPNNTGNAKGRPGRSGTLIGANNSRPAAPPASAPTPAPMPAPKASAPVHPAWLDSFGNAEEEEQDVDEEDIKGRLEEPFNLDKILSGEDSVDRLIGNMLGSGGRSSGLVNEGLGTTTQGTYKDKGKQSPPANSQQALRTGMSSASSSAASSIYNGSMGGKRRMSDAASIASGTSGISTASGMMKGHVSGNGNTNKKKIRAPKMQKKASLFGDSDSDDEDEDEESWGSESGEESTSPSPPVEYYSSNADAILASELMQDPITAAQIQHYLGASSGAKSNGAAGGLGRGSGFGFGSGMEDGMDEGLGALAAEFGVAGIVGGMGMGNAMGSMNGMGRGRESVFGGVTSNAMGMGGMNMGTDDTSSGFGYESWGVPPPKSTKLMASSSSASQNTSQNMWGNQVAANSTTNLGSTLHAPIATPPTLASNLLSSKGAGRATPMPTAPTPGGWKRLNGNAGVGRSAPTPQPQTQAQPHPQIPGLPPHQAQAFLQSQLQAQQQAQFGINSPNMNDPYALAAAALEATLNGSATTRSNPFASGSGSGYASSSGNGYLSSSSAVGASHKSGMRMGKKASPFGSDDEDEVDSGSAGVWGAVMNRGANGKEKKVTTGSMMGSMMNSFAQSQQQQASTVKGKSKMNASAWGVAAAEGEQTRGEDGEDGWGLEYQKEQQEDEEEDNMWGAPKKVPGKSAVNGKKVASSSIMNINASANSKALKEKLEKEKTEKERAEKERLEKEELEKAKAAEKEKAAQPPAPALTGSISKKQNKKQKQAAKKGGAAAVSPPEPEPEPKEPTPPPSPPSPPPPEPTSVSLMSRILPGKGRGRKESVSMLSASTPALSGATPTATINSTSTSNASGGGLFGSWDEKDNGAISNSFSSMSLSTPKQTLKVPSSLLSQQQQPDEFGAGFGFGTTPKQGNMFKSSGAASAWGSTINANTSSTIRASNANSGTTGKGSLWGMFGGGGDKSAATQSSSLSIPGGFDDANDRDDGGGEEGEVGEWEEPVSAWGTSTKKGIPAAAAAASTKPALGTAAQRLRRMSEATSTPPTPPAPVPEPSPPAPSPVANTNAGGKKGKGKKGAKTTNNNTSPVITTVANNKSLKPTIEVLPDEDDYQVRGEILPSDSKHIMEDADGDVGLDLVGGVKEVLGGDEKRVEALMKELRESEAKLGGVSGAGAGAGKNTTSASKSPWGVKSTESAFGAKGSVPTPTATSTPVWGQAARRGKAGAGGKLF